MIMQGASQIQQQRETKAQAQAQAEQTDLQNQLLVRQQSQEVEQRRNLLKQQQASARAALAAGGGGTLDGSGAALLAGMTRQGEDEIASGLSTASLRQQLLYSRQNASTSGLSKANQAFGVMRSFFDSGSSGG